MKKKKIIILILLVIGIIVGLIFSIYQTKQVINPPEETVLPNDDVIVPTPTPTFVAAETPTPQIKQENSFGEYTVPDNKQGELLSQTTAKNIELQARKQFENFEFEEGLKIIRDAIKKYTFDDNGETLEKLYYEASLITSLQTAPVENALDIVSAITDEELLVIATLYAPLQTKASIICNNESLFPIFTGTVKIVNKEIVADDKLEEIKILYPAVRLLCKIEFIIEEEHLYAYIIIYPEKDIALYSFEPISDKTKFFTLKKYREVQNY